MHRRRPTQPPRSSGPGAVRRYFRCARTAPETQEQCHPMTSANVDPLQRRRRIAWALRHNPRRCFRLSRPVSCLRSHRRGAGHRTGLGVGAGERKRPTHGRQGKRPARSPAQVVGWIGEFANVGNTPGWPFRQIVQRFQASESRPLCRHRARSHDHA
jgi:hypothetical protein